MKLKQNKWACWREAAAYSLAETMVAIFLVALLLISLYAGISSGFNFVRLARENLRATQIMVQRTEDYRLYRWAQMTNSAVVTPNFIDYFNPSGTNSRSYGTVYQGTVSDTVPTNVPAAYKDKMRALTVTVYWTNYSSKPSANIIVRSRQMQTLVARYGMQNYVSK